MSEKPTSSLPADSEKKPKRSYSAPQLTSFGSVEAFTRGSGSKSGDFRGGGRQL